MFFPIVAVGALVAIAFLALKARDAGASVSKPGPSRPVIDISDDDIIKPNPYARWPDSRNPFVLATVADLIAGKDVTLYQLREAMSMAWLEGEETLAELLLGEIIRRGGEPDPGTAGVLTSELAKE